MNSEFTVLERAMKLYYTTRVHNAKQQCYAYYLCVQLLLQVLKIRHSQVPVLHRMSQLSIDPHKVLSTHSHAAADMPAAAALSLCQLQLQGHLLLLAALAQHGLQGIVGCALADHVAAAAVRPVEDGSWEQLPASRGQCGRNRFQAGQG